MGAPTLVSVKGIVCGVFRVGVWILIVIASYCLRYSRIYRVQREDAGRYVCIATNAIGTNQDYAHLIVDGKCSFETIPGFAI